MLGARKRRFCSLIILASLAGNVVHGDEGRAGPAAPLPIGSVQRPCPDGGLDLNEFIEFTVIIDHELGTTENMDFFFGLGVNAKNFMSGLTGERLDFGDIQKVRVGANAFLMSAYSTGVCYLYSSQTLTTWYWVKARYYGEPMLEPAMEDNELTAFDPAPPEPPDPPTVERWCMFLETWTANWSEMIYKEPIICWTEEI